MREAVPDDASGIASVQVRGWRAGYRGIVPDEVLDAMSVAERTQLWRELVSDASVRTLVAEDEGAIAGFCSFAASSRDDDAADGVGELVALYVDPDRWRRGVGRALVEEALTRLRASGCRAATAWVFADNERGLAFYARLGFEPDGARGVHERSGRADVRVRRAALRPPAPAS